MATRKPAPAPSPVPEPEHNNDTLAKAIVKISDGMDRLLASGLNRRAVMILLKYETGLSLRNVETVCDSLASLAEKYTNPK